MRKCIQDRNLMVEGRHTDVAMAQFQPAGIYLLTPNRTRHSFVPQAFLLRKHAFLPHLPNQRLVLMWTFFKSTLAGMPVHFAQECYGLNTSVFIKNVGLWHVGHFLKWDQYSSLAFWQFCNLSLMNVHNQSDILNWPVREPLVTNLIHTVTATIT